MNTQVEAGKVDVRGTGDVFHTATQGRKVRKVSNYFDIYDRYLSSFKNTGPRILEIGVQHGGSLLMWDAFFGGRATIVGIDILPECKKFEGNNVEIFIGDQSDKTFLEYVVKQVGKFDIIIDDGSHIPRHQIASFCYLFFNGLSDTGVYICEDCGTSYLRSFGGGVRKSGSFIEFAKRLVDDVNAWHFTESGGYIADATNWLKAVSFFSGVVVFEKAPMERPEAVSAGYNEIDLEADFKSNRFSWFILPLKRNATIKRLVKTNPILWNFMRRFLTPRG